MLTGNLPSVGPSYSSLSTSSLSTSSLSTLWLAQTTTPAPAPALKTVNLWKYSTGGLFIMLIGLGVYSYLQNRKLQKQIKFETYKNKELQKRVKLALGTITKMERNPDLIHSRDFNLDYLRMRMEEKNFNFAIVNQLKVKVKQRISEALRPKQSSSGMVGIASTKPRVVDQIFDVEYTAPNDPKKRKRILFRIQIKLTKLPAQATSQTVEEIVKCIENFLNPQEEEGFWQPTLQGRIANMKWDQKAKPTPLLVLQQTNEGVNVTFRTKKNKPSIV